MYMTTLLFTNFTVAVPSTPTFYAFLKSADGGLAFNFIWKVIQALKQVRTSLASKVTDLESTFYKLPAHSFSVRRDIKCRWHE